MKIGFRKDLIYALVLKEVYLKAFMIHIKL